MAGAEMRLGMSPDYPIVGNHPMVPALRATFDAARDFGLSNAELWCIVQEVLADPDRSSDLSECIGRLNDKLAQAIVAKGAPLFSSG